MGRLTFYRLEKVTESRHGLTTATVFGCSLCGDMIAAMGGPNRGILCVQCGDAITSGKFDRGELVCRFDGPFIKPETISALNKIIDAMIDQGVVKKEEDEP